ncbi:hypothetical protein DJ71_23545 [Halorubrum sp. E3]|nr:hypothetical protein DJ71_23545 [Halorubrum sp. E3]OYR85346.1 hypothetical protein DJ72_04290 [Halorubrum distributum]
MISRVTSFISRNPVTPILLVLMTLVLVSQILVVGYSNSLFEFLFVGQDSITPGLLLAPLSHGTILTHFLPNMMLLLVVGWPLEERLGSRSFTAFTATAAYIPTYLQIIYSTFTAGAVGTAGFSGAVYAFPPVLTCICLRDSHYTELGTVGSLAIGVTIAIPLQMTGILGLLLSSPLPPAEVTHTAGYLIGWSCGLILLTKNHQR